ncbi:hypothetical protein A7X67_04725 [Clostridium sp. W14A]|nr:hypothetical protein A7X67_04725 [Clostridium sp. W14A]
MVKSKGLPRKPLTQQPLKEEDHLIPIANQDGRSFVCGYFLLKPESRYASGKPCRNCETGASRL